MSHLISVQEQKTVKAKKSLLLGRLHALEK